MSKYDEPNVVYHGYIVTTAQFTEMMSQIASYKDLMDNAGYGDSNHVWCYAHWKRLALEEKLRLRAPCIKWHWADGVPHLEELATHVMILTTFIRVERPELVKDPKKLLESHLDRESIDRTVKFLQRRGITGLKVEDLEYTYSVGPNPILITT